MRIRVLLFAQMRIRAARGAVDLELPVRSTLRDAKAALVAVHPELAEHLPSCMTALGLDYAPDEVELHDGAEVSLIPPVQGG